MAIEIKIEIDFQLDAIEGASLPYILLLLLCKSREKLQVALHHSGGALLTTTTFLLRHTAQQKLFMSLQCLIDNWSEEGAAELLLASQRGV